MSGEEVRSFLCFLSGLTELVGVTGCSEFVTFLLFVYGGAYVIFIVMVIIMLYFLMSSIVIKYLFWRLSRFLSNAQSLDTPVHQGSTGDTIKEPGTNAGSSPPNCVG
jgi:hypothetical protein